MPAWFPILLITHIVLAITLILPSILLPFALRTRRSAEESHHPFVRFLRCGFLICLRSLPSLFRACV